MKAIELSWSEVDGTHIGPILINEANVETMINFTNLSGTFSGTVITMVSGKEVIVSDSYEWIKKQIWPEHP